MSAGTERGNTGRPTQHSVSRNFASTQKTAADRPNLVPAPELMAWAFALGVCRIQYHRPGLANKLRMQNGGVL